MVVWLFFWRHARDGRVAGYRVGNRPWGRVHRVECRVPIQSQYRGRRGAQPKFYFRAEANMVRVTRRDGRLTAVVS